MAAFPAPATIRAQVQARGFITGRCSPDRAASLATKLGDIVLKSDVWIDAKARQYFANPRGVPLHTDSPFANLVLFYCIRGPKRGGATYLVDCSDAPSRLDRGTLEALARIEMPVPTLGGRTFRHRPLLDSTRSPPAVNYFPWALPTAGSGSDAVAEFRRYVATKLREEAITVRLEAGQFLLIDNNRMLHGRAAVEAESERLLTRWWINTDGLIE
jgi:alpha-ketoglutarate-dependent taurine dioxygenase